MHFLHQVILATLAIATTVIAGRGIPPVNGPRLLPNQPGHAWGGSMSVGKACHEEGKKACFHAESEEKEVRGVVCKEGVWVQIETEDEQKGVCDSDEKGDVKVE